MKPIRTGLSSELRTLLELEFKPGQRFTAKELASKARENGMQYTDLQFAGGIANLVKVKELNKIKADLGKRHTVYEVPVKGEKPKKEVQSENKIDEGGLSYSDVGKIVVGFLIESKSNIDQMRDALISVNNSNELLVRDNALLKARVAEQNSMIENLNKKLIGFNQDVARRKSSGFKLEDLIAIGKDKE